MTSPALVIEGLRSGYGRTTVINDVDLAVGRGEVVALLGRNGAGKTTLLETVFGFLSPTAGRVTVDGMALRAGDPTASFGRGVALVPESRSLFKQLSVGDNLRVAGADRTDLARAVERFPALEPLLERRAGLLSGGEQQMLAIARALVPGPRVLLVDELSMGLAPVICRHLAELLRDISDRDGVAVVIVEQHLHLALEVADRGYVMRRGRIALTGTATALRDDLDQVQAAYLPDQHDTAGDPDQRDTPGLDQEST